MASRPARSGNSTGTRRSNRPDGSEPVQRFGPVGGSQNDDAVVALEAVHFGQQLVKGLFPLVVAAELSPSRFLPMASISSMNTMQGAFSLACWNRSGPCWHPCPRTSLQIPNRRWRRRGTPDFSTGHGLWPAWSCRCPEGLPAAVPWASWPTDASRIAGINNFARFSLASNNSRFSPLK